MRIGGLALLVVACVGVALAAEEGKLPSADRVSFQTAFPGQEKKCKLLTNPCLDC